MGFEDLDLGGLAFLGVWPLSMRFHQIKVVSGCF